MKKTVIILIYFIFLTQSYAQELQEDLLTSSESQYNYKTPGGFDFVTNIPDDFVQLYVEPKDL